LAQASGLLLSLDGLMPEGGEPQLWVIRELQTGWTVRSGWLANQDEATFVAFLRPVAQEVVRSLDQLLRHRPEPRLRQLRDGLCQALHTLQPTYRELNIAADWLTHLAALLDPASSDPLAPARTGAQVLADWEACLADIEQVRQTSARLRNLGAQIPGLPRTNNSRESEFRELKRRLVCTTGQHGAVKRLLLREGAWELIPTPASLAETIAAISQVDGPILREEERRVRSHRAGFRLHTRSAKQSQAQLKQLVRRLKALPAESVPE
jgi:hypothetical protein